MLTATDEVVETPVQTEIPANTETVVTETVVHSNEVTETPEQIAERNLKAEQARKGYEKRHERNKWKQRPLADAPTPEEEAAVLEQYRIDGFDITDDNVKKAALTPARAAAKQAAIRDAADRKVRNVASSNALAATLVKLGYTKDSSAFQTTGDALIRRLGVDDPSAFEDENLVKAELEAYVEEIRPRQRVDPVAAAVAAKASVPKGMSESRTVGASKKTVDAVKAFAKEYGCSEAKAPELMKLMGVGE